MAHEKFGGEEQLQEHQRARADAKLQSKLRVRCACCAWRAVHGLLPAPTGCTPLPCPAPLAA